MTKQPTPTIEVLPARTGITADVVIGDGDDRQSVRVDVPWKDMTEAQRKQVERMVGGEVKRKQAQQQGGR